MPTLTITSDSAVPSVRAGGASFGRLGRPAIARVLSASEELPMDIVAQGRGE